MNIMRLGAPGRLRCMGEPGSWLLLKMDDADRTLEIVRSFAPRLPQVTIADARARRGLNHARNVGAATAHGDFLAFCDADDVASAGWLDALASAAGRQRRDRGPP